MKILINQTKNILIASLMILFVGCSDFLDVNENPNDPTVSTPSVTLPVAQQSFLSLNATSMNYLGNFIVDNWAVPAGWSAMEELIQYRVTNSFYASIFENSYQSIFKNLTYIENYDNKNELYSAYHVIVAAIKGFQYQYLVDLYGDVPYSEANMRAKNTTPKYDKAEDVYKAVIESLTKAGTLATKMPKVFEKPGTQDIIFGGDMAKWAQFINTIKLRMLIRLSGTGQDAYIKAEIAKIDANGAGYITETVAGNPGYSNNQYKQNSFFGYMGKNHEGKPTDRNDFTVASKYAIDNLSVTKDDRLGRLYSKAKKSKAYKGIEQTTTPVQEGNTSKDLSHVGPGLLMSSEQDQSVMLLSEALFLQAEAVQRGYMAGDAKAFYEKAIIASYQGLKVGADETAEPKVEFDPEVAKAKAEAYFGQAEANIAWDSSPDKIEAIITQKAIALNGTSGIECWIEMTRTGFPKGVPTPAETTEGRPVRLLYPSSELARNANNVPAQVRTDAFKKNPFWKK